MPFATRTAPPIIAQRIELHGRVQGIGLRPAVARLAAEFQLAGSVGNTSRGVHIQIEGSPERVNQFVKELPQRFPDVTQLECIVVHSSAVTGSRDFTIETGVSDVAAVSTPIPRDVAICPDCLTEVASQSDRRHHYPWTSCTTCGPRFSIIESMPFERARTSLEQFPLCAACAREYSDSRDRRFHAQTTGCAQCGPQVWCTDETGQTLAHRRMAIEFAAEMIRQGQIIALRGVGGYQLVCDATSDAAVARLRHHKRRRAKPLAIMVASIDAAEQIALVDDLGRSALADPANPIVLLIARPSNGLAAGIHPEFNSIGVMLPTSALHWMLLKSCGVPLVMTSGNLEGKPLEVTAESAQIALLGIAELWLHHDRPIAHPVDDSVVHIVGGRLATIRLARGFAPLPLALNVRGQPAAFATGGHQKAAFAIANGSQAVLAPHIGDLEDIDCRDRYVAQATALTRLCGVQPELWIHDLHPQYFTTQWAKAQSGRHIAVQHHHAHIAASMLEQGWLDREVLGIAFDGTGYGPDGTIWGGEVLRANLTGFQRVGHLRTFPLFGGEAAIREPVRVTLALACQSFSRDELVTHLTVQECEEMQRLRPLLKKPDLALHTSSAGRLFDGVAALVLGVKISDFDGQPAQLLEAICDQSDTQSYHFEVDSTSEGEIDWRSMIRKLLVDRRQGVSPGQLAMRFHRGLAQAIAEVCRRYPELPVVLTGGTFQNKVLVELVIDLLGDHPQPIALPGTIPVNDGGLAAGQLAVGMAIYAREYRSDLLNTSEMS